MCPVWKKIFRKVFAGLAKLQSLLALILMHHWENQKLMVKP